MPHRAHVHGRRAPARGARDDPRDRGRASARRRSRSCCRCSSPTSRRSSPPWPACRSRCGCSTRRCTSSCPTARRWPSSSRSTEPGPERTRLERLAERVRQLSEQNPMLGTRGCRLALLHPGIYAMQVRAIVRGALAAAARGEAAQIEIMIPLVAYAEELRRMRELVEEVDRGGAGERRPRARDLDRDDDRAAARGAARRRDRRVRRLLLVRHERPHADDARLLARRRRVGLPRDLPRGRRDRAQPVRERRHRRRRRARADRRRARSRGPARAQARHLRRARRRSGLGGVLPRRRPRLRLLLAVPGADRAPGRRPRRARRHGIGR